MQSIFSKNKSFKIRVHERRWQNDTRNNTRKIQESIQRNKDRRSKRGFYIHLVIYILVNIILIVINPTYTSKVIWFPYPLIG
ncbi:MAG: 2TM domain-containing protein [archaeon GB-1867-035]|nr:2TM domain-containing protein [Candidatus Culexmicrobium profundum]